MYDIVCLGEALIDFFAVEGEIALSDVSSFQRIAGGAPGNVSVGGAKLGLETAFITRVGSDAFGRHIIDKFKSNKVDTIGIQIDPEIRTGLVFISLPTTNTREFLFYRNPGADMMLEFAKIPEGLLEYCRVFHFGSISQISDPSRSTTSSALDCARKHGATISYDPNIRLSLWPDEKLARETILRTIPRVDIVKVNDEEIHFLFPNSDILQGMKMVLALGPKLVLCTKGEFGSAFATRHAQGEQAVFPVKTVDSTGCGDSFLSAFLSRICKTSLSEIEEDRVMISTALRFGAAAAALTALKKGVTEALPTNEEVTNFLLSRESS